jgi:hypothetical protein
VGVAQVLEQQHFLQQTVHESRVQGNVSVLHIQAVID